MPNFIVPITTAVYVLGTRGNIFPLFVLANIIYLPIVFEFLNATNARFVYSVLAVVTIIVGLVTSLTFRERRDSDAADDVTCAEDSYTKLESEQEECLSLRSRVVMGSLWFCASLCKCTAYYGMYMTLVSIYLPTYVYHDLLRVFLLCVLTCTLG